ncbi:SusD-like starch-binding protein associating with outer membrane [Chitinophaga dinghuensis]|uniref:SusD-like starch-binding protein associating with outer membrane n=1 Tax=Chitinophaga dinghuensis TaxID=1539050 RepID=A0A327VZ40_9BACT|nr:RagB/SusD family nutrient uptake outer membrane protein [Chitinophaga dinghuensis]RAJ80074.1 SusD-like starch-binding protein associating with outer membrane [Chitinophaga dinghuensis]
MKKRYLLYAITAFTALTTSCNKYLDVEPKGKVLLKTVNDYDLWLNSRNLTTSADQNMNLLSDEGDIMTINPQSVNSSDLVYLWRAQYTPDPNTSPLFWGRHYSNIYRFNAVLNGMNTLTDGTPQDKSRLTSEALLGRAFEYFYLMNLYCQPYQASKAASTPGIPFVTTNEIAEKTPPRGTLKAIYDQVISDLTTAIPGLPDNNDANKFRGSKTAAYSVLARVYYYGGDNVNADKYARMVLQNNNSVFDYNTVTAGNKIPAMVVCPQEIYARYGSSPGTAVMASLELLNLYDSTDLRMKYFYRNRAAMPYTKRGVTAYGNGQTSENFGTSVPEMKLIVAEIAALNNDLSTAVTQLNDIRVKRYPAAVYKPITVTDQATVMSQVMRERRIELAFKGIRWLDMRKLSTAGKMPLIQRLDSKSAVIATLKPNDAKYTLQIPSAVMLFNVDMEQNGWE